MLVAAGLSNTHMISIENNLPELHNRVQLNIQESDIETALLSDEFFAKILRK
jgi:hypothetical protein